MPTAILSLWLHPPCLLAYSDLANDCLSLHLCCLKVSMGLYLMGEVILQAFYERFVFEVLPTSL